MKTIGKQSTHFDRLVAAAAKNLTTALDERDADEVTLRVWRNGRGEVELYFEERELTGTLAPGGTVSLGRKP